MSRRKLHAILLIIVLLACIDAQQQQQRLSIPNFTKHLNYSPNDLTLTYSIDDGASFAHASCRRRNEQENKASGRVYKKCRLTVERITTAGKSFTQTCDMKLYPKWNSGSVGRQFKLVRFGEDYLVFVWREIVDYSSKRRRRRYIPYPVIFKYRKDHLRVEVVHMKSCKTKKFPLVSEQRDKIYEPKMCGITSDQHKSEEECRKLENETEIYAEDEGKIHNVNVVVNGDESFDLFFRNENLCGRERRCKVTYDSRSEKFSSVIVAPFELKYDATIEIHPIVSERESSTILAYVVRSLYLDEGTLTLVTLDGQKLFEHLYSWSPFNLRKGISTMAISTIEENLGICQQSTTEPVMQCSLFDTQGQGLIGVDVALTSSEVAVIEMRNTFDGGFLLLIGYGNATTINGLEALDILRIDSKGELANVYKAKNHKCWRDKAGVDVGLVEKSATHVCYYMACTWPMPKMDIDETHWQLFGECF